MASTLMARISWQYLNDDPKNQAVITPKFRINGVLDDHQQLANDLCTAISGWGVAGMANTQTTVTTYNVGGAGKHPPTAKKVLQPGTYATPVAPPELACALSYYAGTNTPRKRGRLYVPAFMCSTATSSFGSMTCPVPIRTKVAALVPIFAALGGANVDWVVWSPTAQIYDKVTDWWVDDAWDIIRGRGIAPTTRDKGTTSG